MPELPNRDAIDEALSSLVAAELARQQERLASLLGNPPDARNVPDGYWRQLAISIYQTLFHDLEAAFITAAQQHAADIGQPEDAVALRAAAVQWAMDHVDQTVSSFVETTRQKASAALRAYHESAEQEQSQGALVALLLVTDSAQADAAALAAARHEQYVQHLADIFSRSRAEGVAVTSNTLAGVAGERWVSGKQLADSGEEWEAYWQTERDRLVCPVCADKQGKLITDVWPGQAHPRCRCFPRWVRKRMAA